MICYGQCAGAGLRSRFARVIAGALVVAFGAFSGAPVHAQTSVSSVTITSDAKTYAVGDDIEVNVVFGAVVHVDQSADCNNDPKQLRLVLNVGEHSRNAAFIEGSGTTTLKFRYTVQYGDLDEDGVSIGPGDLWLQGACIVTADNKAVTRTFNGLPADSSRKVDGVSPVPTRVRIESDAEDDYYVVGDDIEVSVRFDETVHVDESITELVLVLSIGQHSRSALFVSGSGTVELTFRYTVQDGDLDSDGISIGALTNALKGGRIEDGVGNPVDRTFDAVPANTAHKVDGVRPTIDQVRITSNPAADQTYRQTETITVRVDFDDAVNVTTTGLVLALSIGQHSREATPSETNPTGVKKLTFSYTVQSGDSDVDGISIGPTALRGGVIADVRGNALDRTFSGLTDDSGHKVNGVSPDVRMIRMASAPVADDTYGLNEEIRVAVDFGKTVHVTNSGALSLVIAIGQHSRSAAFAGGSGTDTLTFRYVVQSDDYDADGVSIGPNPLRGGVIEDGDGNLVDRTFDGLGVQSGHKVDGTTTARSAFRIVSTPAVGGTYGLDEEIAVEVDFGEAVVVTGNTRDVTLMLTIGQHSRSAAFVSGSGTDTLRFRYTVRSDDYDADGISIESDALQGGTILNARTRNAVDRTFVRLVADRRHRVNGSTRPLRLVRIVSTPNSGGIYGLNEDILVEIDFGESVHVSGNPLMMLSIGEHSRAAALADGSGTAKLTFSYAVQEDDQDSDGISIGPNALRGGVIEDAAGNPVERTFAGLEANSRHRVDGVIPVMNRVRIVSPPGHDGYYSLNEEITIEVEFGEEVHVKVPVTVDLNIGEHTRQATYVIGSGTSTLTFRYVVQSDDQDDNGISIPPDCLRGIVRDAAGNDADRFYRGRPADSRHKVDGASSARLRVHIVAPNGHDGIYGLNEEIRVTVNFPEAVHVTGNPTLTLSVGEHSRAATLVGGSGTETLTFGYVVRSGDTDDDGISIGPNALRDGVIENAAGDAVDRTFSGLEADGDHKVDGVSPSLTDVTIVTPADHDGVYGVNEEIRVEVDFGEKVHVTGDVSLVLSIGEHLRTAALVGGSGTETLTFGYVVRSGDSDDDGISIGPNALQGTDIRDTAGNAVVLDFDGLVADGAHKVDGIGPELTDVSIVSSPGSGGFYGRNESIDVEVEFGEDVHVTSGEADLAIMLSVGQHLRAANFVSGSGTDTLTFRYVVQAGDFDEDGISIGPNALRGGTIGDAAGNEVVRTFIGKPADGRHKVKAVAAVVATVEKVVFRSEAGPNDTYTTDDQVQVDVMFNVPVYVTGAAPVLRLSIGSVLKDALFQGGSGTSTLKFAYTVELGDTDDDGISIGPNALVGSIEDGSGNVVDLTLPAMEAQAMHKVSAELMLYPLSLRLLAGQAEVIDLSKQLEDLGVDYGGHFGATSDDSSVATAEVADGMLTITSVAEGAATITAKAVDAAIYLIFGVTVETSPEETAALEGALAAVGRGIIASTASTIGARLESSRTDTTNAWGARRLAPAAVAAGRQGNALDRIDQLGSVFGHGHWVADDPYLERSAGYALGQWLRGASFEMPMRGFGNPITSWSVWGAGDWHAFEGGPDSGMYDGSLTSVFLGIDARGNGWISGAAFSHAMAEASYEFGGDVAGEGRLETELNVIHPYVQWAFQERGKMWGILGFGSGEATAERVDQEASRASSDLSMLMGLGGLRYEFGPIVGFDFAFRGDAGFAQLETDEGPRAIQGLTVNVQRLRMGVEASLPMALAGVPMSPFIDLAGRYDGGDGATGGGLELAGGFRYRGPMVGLEVKGRALAMHTDESYSEEGVKATLIVGPDGRQGFRLALSPRWGGTAEAMDIFDHRSHPFAGAVRRDDRAWGLGTRVSYGFDMRRWPGTVMPYWEVDLSRDAYRRARLGVSYELASAFAGLPHRLEISGENAESDRHGGIMRFLLSGQAHF